jgi:hypothetical protein
MPPPKQGHWVEILVGAVLGGVDAVGSGLVGIAFAGNIDNGAWFFLPLAIGLLIPVVLMFNAATRWWGVGILIGYFLTVIVLGGACIALIATLGG